MLFGTCSPFCCCDDHCVETPNGSWYQEEAWDERNQWHGLATGLVQCSPVRPAKLGDSKKATLNSIVIFASLFLFPPLFSFTPALCPGCFQIWLNRLSGVSSFWFVYAIKEFAERDLIIIFPIKIFFDRYPAFSDTRASTIYYCMCSFLLRCWHRFYNWVKTAGARCPLPRCTSCYPLGVPISCVYYRCQYFRFNSVSPLQKVKDHRSRQINCSKSIPSCFFWLLVFAAGRKEEG